MPISDLICNVEIYLGSLWPLTMTLTDDNDVPVSLVGFTVFCEIRTQPGGTLLATPHVVITPAGGQIYYFLLPTETKMFGAKSGYIDALLVEIADPTNVRPLLIGDVSTFPQNTVIQKTLIGNTHNGTDVIDLADTSQMVIGMAITGVGVGVGASVATIDVDHVHASVVSTADGTVSLTFTL